MSVAQAHLVIYQGTTFRSAAIACSLADQGIANIQAWALGSNTFHLSVGFKGDHNFLAVATGTVSFSTNAATLDIDESITAAITARGGRFRVEASNGTDRWPVIQGAWELVPDSA